MLRIAVCDDDCRFCSEIEEIILDYSKQAREEIVIEIFYTGESLLQSMNCNKFDIVFLDIQMEKISGIEVGKVIRSGQNDYRTQLVYISSRSDYCQELLEVQPLHFLLKPVAKEMIIKDILLAKKITEINSRLFTFKNEEGFFKVPVHDIIYFESIGRKVKLVSLKQTVFFYDKLESVMDRIKIYRFLSPHRSFVVNYDNILKIGKDEIITCNNDKIPLSRLKKKEVKEKQLFFEEEGLYDGHL